MCLCMYMLIKQTYSVSGHDKKKTFFGGEGWESRRQVTGQMCPSPCPRYQPTLHEDFCFLLYTLCSVTDVAADKADNCLSENPFKNHQTIPLNSNLGLKISFPKFLL